MANNTQKQTVNTESDNARRIAEITRIKQENDHARKLAESRNSRPIYAFLYSDEMHAELWGLSQLEKTTMTFARKGDNGTTVKSRESVIVGKLGTALMTCIIGQKGKTTRGAIKPIAFWYILKTGECGAFNGATQEERDYIAMYVGGLMKKYLAGVAMIEKGEYHAVKGFDSRRNKDKFGKFMQKYMNLTTKPTDEEIDMSLASTAKTTESAKPVNMD